MTHLVKDAVRAAAGSSLPGRTLSYGVWKPDDLGLAVPPRYACELVPSAKMPVCGEAIQVATSLDRRATSSALPAFIGESDSALPPWQGPRSGLSCCRARCRARAVRLLEGMAVSSVDELAGELAIRPKNLRSLVAVATSDARESLML
jgi:hypothetical protein